MHSCCHLAVVVVPRTALSLVIAKIAPIFRVRYTFATRTLLLNIYWLSLSVISLRPEWVESPATSSRASLALRAGY